MQPASFFSLVVPTYNEAGNIVNFLTSAHAVLANRPHEIIVVDDDSPDQTWKIVSEFGRENPWARSHRRVGERGLSSAVLAGFGMAQGNYLGVMDADLSHDEKILPLLISEVENGAQLAIGSRRIPGGGATKWPWYRRWSSGGATALSRFFLNLNISDPMSGYFVLSRSFYESCRDRLTPLGYKILLEIYCQGAPQIIKEVPFIFKDRTEGQSKVSFSVAKQFLQMLVRLRFHR